MRTETQNGVLTAYLEGRIDSNNAAQVERELFAAVADAPDADLTLDAEKLAYLSSAGLRVLMKLRKSAEKPVKVINVSPEVYEIFEVTGFTELLEIQKALRKLSVDGLTRIGMGATAQVYRLDRETVVKVFNPNVSLEVIRQENERSRNAFLSGIPTVIAFDMVRVEDRYGAVYELLDAQDFLTVLEGDKPHLAEHIRKFAHAMREMHRIEVDPKKFPPSKPGSLAVLPRLEGVCTREEIDKLRRMYEMVPDRSTFIHGDSHPGNVMVQGGEFVFIDLMTCGSGHPIFDLASMCTAYHIPRGEAERQQSPLLRNFTEDETRLIWNTYLRAYLDTEDEDIVRRAERQITAFSSARTLFAAVFIPGLLPPEHIDALKKNAISYVDDGLEPICF